MPLLREEITNRGVEGSIPAPNDEVEIPTTDAETISTLVSLFGQHTIGNPQLARLCNAYGPLLFASLLFTLAEDYDLDPEDDTKLIPKASVLEAEEKCIGMIRAVASAMGEYYGDITRSPSEAEIDADTDMVPVSDNTH